MSETVESRIDDAPGVGGVVWTLPPDGDLNANLVRLASGRSIDEHVNDEVDVLIVVRSGDGELVIDGTAHPVSSTAVALVPRGASRSLTAGDDGISYLSIHRRRGPMTIGSAGSADSAATSD